MSLNKRYINIDFGEDARPLKRVPGTIVQGNNKVNIITINYPNLSKDHVVVALSKRADESTGSTFLKYSEESNKFELELHNWFTSVSGELQITFAVYSQTPEVNEEGIIITETDTLRKVYLNVEESISADLPSPENESIFLDIAYMVKKFDDRIACLEESNIVKIIIDDSELDNFLDSGIYKIRKDWNASMEIDIFHLFVYKTNNNITQIRTSKKGYHERTYNVINRTFSEWQSYYYNVDGYVLHYQSKSYIKGSIVLVNGEIYIAIADVPENVEITDTDYWMTLKSYVNENFNKKFRSFEKYFTFDEDNDIITMNGDYRIYTFDVEERSYFRRGFNSNYVNETFTKYLTTSIEHGDYIRLISSYNYNDGDVAYSKDAYFKIVNDTIEFKSESGEYYTSYTQDSYGCNMYSKGLISIVSGRTNYSTININDGEISLTSDSILINDDPIVTQDDIANLQAQIDSMPVFSKTVESNAYSVVVPKKALDYALVENVGGMSYVSPNLYQYNSYETNQNLTIAENNGDIIINGTMSVGSTLILKFKTPISKGVYTLGLFNYTVINNLSIGFLLADGTTSWKSLNTINDTYSTTVNQGIQGIWIGAMGAITFNNFKIKPILVEGSTAPTEFVPYFEGIRNSAVTSISFNQKNLLPIVPRQVLSTPEDGSYLVCNLDTEGWYHLKRTQTENITRAKSLNILAPGIGPSHTAIPAGKYSIKVIFKNTFSNSRVAANIGSLVAVYKKSYSDEPEQRAFTIGVDLNKMGYQYDNFVATKPISNIYFYIATTTDIHKDVVEDEIVFKVELVKNSFFEDRVEIPSEVQALEGYGLGINEEYNNYIDLENKKYVRKVRKIYLKDLSWEKSVNNTVIDTYVAYIPIEYKSFSLGKFVCDIKGIELLNKYSTNKNVMFINSDVQIIIRLEDYGTTTLEDLLQKLEEENPTFIYPLDTPIEEDISDLLEDEYIEVQEGGTIIFENEHKHDVPNTITYALKVV